MIELTSPQLAAVGSDEQAVGLIPLGAVEQHGPHLPVATDAIIARHLAGEVAARLTEPVLVAPVLPLGVSAHHLGFAGTVHLDAEAFGACVRAYADAMRDLGLRRVAIFSAHGGNFAAIAEVAASYADDPGVEVIAYTDFTRYLGAMRSGAGRAGVVVPDADTHAGGLETSQILYLERIFGLDPAGVPDGYAADEEGWVERMNAEGIAALSANGVLGLPRLATSPAGRAICAALADELAEWIREAFGLAQADGASS
ncbi:Creatininase [Conexibacter woesei DSM 14684]|uniref:Creatininase n=2 Tax=Conexibacter TaxID=191494 RepID=D3FAQ0_CONWI|nr:Creatininase [Conexibacter woesei DSM 14684]